MCEKTGWKRRKKLYDSTDKSWSSANFMDTFKKGHNGPGGVSWKSEGRSVENSDKKSFNGREREERFTPK